MVVLLFLVQFWLQKKRKQNGLQFWRVDGRIEPVDDDTAIDTHLTRRFSGHSYREYMPEDGARLAIE